MQNPSPAPFGYEDAKIAQNLKMDFADKDSRLKV